MTVVHLWTLLNSYHVSGQGYAPHGGIYDGPKKITATKDQELKELLAGGLLADNAQIQLPDKKHHDYVFIGDPTEGCLEVVAKREGLIHKKNASQNRAKGNLRLILNVK